ncbi:MAG: DNA translocase FtsK, partial [Lachnospiraceae bacterium]|nr:DNA translocase FtsK [Lachnospiraceae bacterium]
TLLEEPGTEAPALFPEEDPGPEELIYPEDAGDFPEPVPAYEEILPVTVPDALTAEPEIQPEEEVLPVITPMEPLKPQRPRAEVTKKEEPPAPKAEVPEKKPEPPAAPEPAVKAGNAEYQLPSTSLLKNSSAGRAAGKKELNDISVLLEQTLRSFNVEAHVTDTCQGPSVTRFELQLGEGIKVNKILNLSDDLKLKLAAEEIRIEAPIPGKAAVGIEVPNKERIPVSLRELLESKEFKDSKSLLSFVVGKDISGHVIIGDISKMPHLMVAGTTGSGKSVFTNSIIQSILFKAKPEEVKLILIDPKVVEFSVYNGIPHLLTEVVTDPHKANQALAWAVAEMSRRYKVFAEHSVRGISGYNELADSGKLLDEEGNPLPRMYSLVIVVDELADLMMVAGKEVEASICRIAQLARAAGIHLVIATQRPSVDVITGLIKANMPSRVALKCGSGIDSRTILDTTGAEKLLGYGDMLYSPQGFTKPLRVQGAFVSDGEVKKVADFWKSQVASGEAYDKKVEEEMRNIPAEAPSKAGTSAEEEGDGGNDLDEYFEKACRFVVEKEKASSGMLQRIFKVGYNRAARIVDQMEAAGVVGPEEGTKPRKVLMNAEQLESFLRSRKGEEKAE